jgi:negative regulator of flagellin synthesis FlgM
MVDPINFGPIRPVNNQASPAQAKKATTIVPKTPSHEGIVTLPKLLGLANELASQGPPIDSAKIAEIRTAIASGSYKVKPQEVANAMLAYYGGGFQ